MIITPISPGPFQNLKHRGSWDAQKRAIYENFQGKSRSVLLLANLLFNIVFLKKRKDLAAVIFRWKKRFEILSSFCEEYVP
ncbi:hypothetical protein CRI69_10515 [Escherichia sp. E4742]|nr:hypothetical protein CRI69_10515 [Escherichia sp. E4742]